MMNDAERQQIRDFRLPLRTFLAMSKFVSEQEGDPTFFRGYVWPLLNLFSINLPIAMTSMAAGLSLLQTIGMVALNVFILVWLLFRGATRGATVALKGMAYKSDVKDFVPNG